MRNAGVRTVRAECTYLMLIYGEIHFHVVLQTYAGHYSGHRHQFRQQRPPDHDEPIVVPPDALVRRRRAA